MCFMRTQSNHVDDQQFFLTCEQLLNESAHAGDFALIHSFLGVFVPLRAILLLIVL